jgi:hypothetical protein
VKSKKKGKSFIPGLGQYSSFVIQSGEIAKNGLLFKTGGLKTNGFRKREVVITTEEQYPQDILVEFIQDKCDLLNRYSIGQDVKININLRGKEWINSEGIAKYFNAIQG